MIRLSAVRLSALSRLGLGLVLALFFLHFLSSFSDPTDYGSAYYSDYGDSSGGVPPGSIGGWGERFGLDHYADWEAGMAGRLGEGLGRVKDGLGAIKGGLGWGVKGAKLGNLYDLVATSNPTPRPSYFDERTSIDRLRLTSTRLLGHGQSKDESNVAVDTDVLGPSLPTEADDSSPIIKVKTRRHLLVTGGFGSLAKFVVRDMLLGLSAGSTSGGMGNIMGDWSDMAGGDPAADFANAMGGNPGTNSAEEDVLITLVDLVDKTGELNFLLQTAPKQSGGSAASLKGTDPRTQAFTSKERSVDNFKKSGKLRVLIGDVRDEELLKTLLIPSATAEKENGESGDPVTGNARMDKKPKSSKNHVGSKTFIPPVSGIIHLAAYNPVSCKINPADCESVETDGMKAILKALGREGLESPPKKKGDKSTIADRPWIVIPRRGSSWDDANIGNVNSSRSFADARESIKHFSTLHPLHSLLLSLPSSDSLIGDPFSPRFAPVPHIVQSALGHLPIQVVVGRTSEPFMAMDDAARSIIQGARMLELASKKAYLRSLAFVAELKVTGPVTSFAATTSLSAGSEYSERSPISQLAKTAMALTMSQSPFEAIDWEVDDIPRVDSIAVTNLAAMNSGKILTKALGFTPSTTVNTGLKAYIGAILQLQSSFLNSKTNVACSSPPSTPVLEEGVLALSGCNAQLLTVIEGSYFTLGCSAGLEGSHLEPLALVPAIPYKEGVRGVEIVAERGLENRVDLQLRCPAKKDGKITEQSEIVIWADTKDGGEFAEQNQPGVRPIAEWYSVDFVARDSRSFTLTLPPTEGVPEGEEPRRKLTFKDNTGQGKQLLFQPIHGDIRPLMWRLNPICCAASDRRRDVWDFFMEDPVLTSQVTYPSEDGRTTLAESTLSIQRCRDLRAQHDEITKIQRFLASSASEGPICDPARGDSSTWGPKDLPTCSTDCSAPLVCLAGEICKCTRDRCGDKKAKGPFPAVAYSNRTSFGAIDTKAKSLTMTERVEAIPWEAVILPGARHAFNKPIEDLPRAHVIELPKTIDNHMTSVACYDLDKSPLPFLGDHILIEALRNESIPIEEADFSLIPYYQGCYYNYLQENTFKKLADTVSFAETRIAAAEHMTGSRIAIPFTHDFGSCTGWWPRLEDVLGRSPPSPMDQAVAWQVNGDYNTHCVKPERDVVIPAVTKHTKALAETFKTYADVAPVNTRKHLAFFAGGVRGFGAVVRTKIGCGRTGQDPNSQILYQQFSPGQRYLGTLNSAKFCLLPRGIPAWTTRTFEAIYAGCIPAFIVDRNIFPFQDILDYSLFSVTIPENESHRVEEILSAYSEEQLVELQAHLLKVREAFIFREGEEWTRKGPLFFTLVSMALRLSLGYPAVGSCIGVFESA